MQRQNLYSAIPLKGLKMKIKLVDEPIDLSLESTKPDSPVKNPKETLKALQLKLLRLHLALYREQRRVVIVFEGTDTAGKGGVIRRLTRNLDPRGVRVWPIGAPTPEESRHHYLQRFWRRLPEHGEIAVFDRSWYGRVLVERVEGFCDEAAWSRAYREINEFERQLVDDDVVLIKIFLNLSKKEQLRRLMDRIREPSKRWKITAADLQSRNYWDDYQQAYQDMLNKTATVSAPWHVVPADDKQTLRIEAMKIIVEKMEAIVDASNVSLLSPEVIALVIEQFGENILQPVTPEK